MTSRTAAPRRRLPTSPFNRLAVDMAPVETFAVADQVTHDRYGLGTVVTTEGARSVVVDFGSGLRRIQLPNPKLARL